MNIVLWDQIFWWKTNEHLTIMFSINIFVTCKICKSTTYPHYINWKCNLVEIIFPSKCILLLQISFILMSPGHQQGGSGPRTYWDRAKKCQYQYLGHENGSVSMIIISVEKYINTDKRLLTFALFVLRLN